jgi:hypothetical protein
MPGDRQTSITEIPKPGTTKRHGDRQTSLTEIPKPGTTKRQSFILTEFLWPAAEYWTISRLAARSRSWLPEIPRPSQRFHAAS